MNITVFIATNLCCSTLSGGLDPAEKCYHLRQYTTPVKHDNDRPEPARPLPLLPGQRARVAPETVQAYAGDVGRFLDWMDATGADVGDMSPLLLGNYVFHLSKARKRRSTLKRNVAAVGSLYRFLTSADGRWRASPVPDARDYPMNEEERQPHWIGEAEAARLMDAADDVTPRGLRDRALLDALPQIKCY